MLSREAVKSGMLAGKSTESFPTLCRETRVLSHHAEPSFRPEWAEPFVLRALRDFEFTFYNLGHHLKVVQKREECIT